MTTESQPTKVESKPKSISEESQPTKVESKPKSISELLEADRGDDLGDVSPAVLEKVDVRLPKDFQLEVMADELLAHLSNFHKATAAWKSARNQGDHAKAEQMFRLRSYCKLAAAIIQDEYEGVRAVAEQLAAFRVKRARAEREAALAEPEE